MRIGGGGLNEDLAQQNHWLLSGAFALGILLWCPVHVEMEFAVIRWGNREFLFFAMFVKRMRTMLVQTSFVISMALGGWLLTTY